MNGRLIRRSARLLSLLSLLLILLGGLRLVAAQARNTIAYGQTVSGRVTNAEFRTVYTFQGQQGEIIDAKLRRTRGNLDPVLILVDGEDNLIARDDDGDSGYDAALISVALPRDGLYFLIATRFGQERGLTTGDYELTLARVGIVSDPNLETGATPIGYGDSIVLELNNQTYEHLYTFAALRGDIVTITMQRISGDLDPLLILADARGNVLLINDDDPESPGSLDAGITNYRVQRSGNYLIAATRFGRAGGTTRGGYSLTLNRLAPDTLGYTPELAITLDPGMVATGEINADRPRRYYLVEARADDILRLEIARTGGNLDPVLELFTEDLRPLTTHDAGARGQFARITAYRVLRDGTYLLVASRFNQETGRTAGTYSLTFTVNPED